MFQVGNDGCLIRETSVVTSDGNSVTVGHGREILSSGSENDRKEMKPFGKDDVLSWLHFFAVLYGWLTKSGHLFKLLIDGITWIDRYLLWSRILRRIQDLRCGRHIRCIYFIEEGKTAK